VFRWSLKKITIYSVVLLIAWRTLTAQKWLPSTWSKSDPIKFLSRSKHSCVGHENAVFISLNSSNFLRAFSSFSVQNLIQQRYIKAVEIVRKKEAAYFYRENKASILDAKIQVNLCFWRNMQGDYEFLVYFRISYDTFWVVFLLKSIFRIFEIVFNLS